MPAVDRKILRVGHAGVIIPMPGQRPAAAILAEMETKQARHAAEMLGLAAELAGAPKGDRLTERILEIKQAADAIGWSETTMRRNIVRYHRDHADRPAWAVQFGGKKKSKWSVYVDRLKAIIASGEPFDK